VTQNQKAIEQPERYRRQHEEVDCRDAIDMKGGASYYGVSDVAALARDTHKFESRYLDWLIGSYPPEESRYRMGSPL
jgi:hypothetical protein